MANVYQGYSGIAEIEGEKIRCTSFNVNPKQDILWYDHIVGLRDTVPSTLDTKQTIATSATPSVLQKTLYRPSVKIVQGNMEFPLTENISDLVFRLARTGAWFDMDFDYYCESARSFTSCIINSYTLSAVAGDVVSVSLGIIGIGLTDTTTTSLVGSYRTAEKLITWDTMDVRVSGSGELWDNISSFDMTINNNVKPVYTSGANRASANNLNPFTLRVGMQHVTGTLVKYNKRYQTQSVNGPINIRVLYPPSIDFTMKTIFKPMTADGHPGPIVSAYGYECVDYHFY